MADESLVLDFSKSPTFFRKWNIDFTVAQMESTSNNFRLILCSDCYDDFSDCIDANGVLLNTNDISHTLACSLKYTQTGADNVDITLRNAVTLTLGTDIEELRGIFLCNTSNYVIEYCIFNQPLQITNKLVFDADLEFISISNGRGV